MKIQELVKTLENMAPLALQEDYDNAGLVTGNHDQEVDRCLVCLDVSPEVIEEAVSLDIHLIISHHPVIFRGVKRLDENDLTGGMLIRAIKSGIALYSMHTNLDNVMNGVNGILADKIGLKDQKILRPIKGGLMKLVTFCPTAHAGKVREAIFSAGAGVIGNYDCCSYNIEGKGSFRANDQAKPFVGEAHKVHFEEELRIETILPAYLATAVTRAMIEAHPYEEVAYDLYPLANANPMTGAGRIGILENEMGEEDFLKFLKSVLHAACLRYSPITGKKIKKVALCGGAGSFLIPDAVREQADVFITGDLKYHQFFEPNGNFLLVDAGHFETEQFTVELIASNIKDIFPNFAVHISKMSKNPVNYL